MTREEKIQKLQEAKDLLNEAVDIVAEIFPKDGNVMAYWIDQVAEHIEKGNQYNLDINDLMEKVEDDEDELCSLDYESEDWENDIEAQEQEAYEAFAIGL